ncbi:hypothetical protein BHE74_00017664 [Ensete ventricosum]|nr:hypothetical protein BHE74_00017664 [Ensete ventricosum]
MPGANAGGLFPCFAILKADMLPRLRVNKLFARGSCDGRFLAALFWHFPAINQETKNIYSGFLLPKMQRARRFLSPGVSSSRVVWMRGIPMTVSDRVDQG